MQPALAMSGVASRYDGTAPAPFCWLLIDALRLLQLSFGVAL
jgi:hypothetical protein